MKKRVLSLFCVLCLLMGTLPVTVQAAVTGSDARAYLDILDRTKPENSYLIDFDNDGRTELLTFSVPGDFVFSVYQGTQTLATVAGNAESGEVCVKDGKTYICVSYGCAGIATYAYYTVRNGQWVKVETFDMTWDWDPDNEVETSSTYWHNDREVSEREYNAAYNQYQRRFSFYEFNISGDARPELEAALYADMTPEELLRRIVYRGDPAKCKMDAQMATAYADALEAEAATCDYGIVTAALLDVAGDGYPLLCIGYIDEECDTATFNGSTYAGDGAGYAGLWTYQNGRASRYDFSADRPYLANSGYPYLESDGWYGVGGHLEVVTLNGEPFLCAEGNGGGGVDLYDRDIYYRVSRAQLTPVHAAISENYRYDGQNYDYDMENLSDYLDGVRYPKGSGYEEMSPMKKALGLKPDYCIQFSGSDLFLEIETSPARGAISALRAYAAAYDVPTYPAFIDILGTGWETDPVAAAQTAVPGEAAACYSLTDGMCYVIIKTGDGYQGVLVQARLQRGRVSWQAIRADQEPVAQEELMASVNAFLSRANLTLDFGKLRGNVNSGELADYLRSLLADVEGKGPNDLAKRDLASFIENALAALSTQTVSGRKNRLTLDGRAVSNQSGDARDAYQDLFAALEESGVTLNKTITPTVRAFWDNVDLDEPCQIDLDTALARTLDGCDLQVLLGNVGTHLTLAADDLNALTRELGGALSVQLSREGEGSYDIRFLNGQGDVVDQLSRPVTVSLPAGSELDTIMASYAGGSDNWGGQYDPATGAISFEARYSGRYEVLENNVVINDIAALGEESQAAIRFMVSKGYFAADNGLFRPGDSLNRYEFTQALVGMFFALDRELTADFPDVPPDSPYYPYVASAQARSIVNGYDNGTFSGADPINREQVFALVARTLMDQKGYTQPQDFEMYLTFADRSALSQWAAPQVALAVREGIAGRGEVLLPQENITREQAAVVLYRLFQLLYEVSPVALDVAGTRAVSLPLVIGVCVGALAVAGGATAAGILLARRRKKRKAQTPVQ